jgi:hypothetical protein
MKLLTISNWADLWSYRPPSFTNNLPFTTRIYIDSIRYPATPYKPLLPISRCYKCQQYGHTLQNCTNEAKCYKCGQLHPYNPNCTNSIKCANCTGSHIAGSPECPVKISYRKQQQQQQQQQQQTTRMFNQSTTSNYFPSPARLYSNVLQTVTFKRQFFDASHRRYSIINPSNT